MLSFRLKNNKSKASISISLAARFLPIKPFEPVIKKTELHPDGAIFARGACDDKGQMYMHVKALEYMTQNDDLPCNVKFMIEGEEEVGSPSLGAWCAEHKEMLQADIILVSDTGMIASDIPSITTHTECCDAPIRLDAVDCRATVRFDE